MPCHISRQDHADHTLAERFELIIAKGFQEVIVFLLQECKALCNVIVLLHCLVVVSDGSLAHRVHMVSIVHSVMAEVVAN